MSVLTAGFNRLYAQCMFTRSVGQDIDVVFDSFISLGCVDIARSERISRKIEPVFKGIVSGWVKSTRLSFFRHLARTTLKEDHHR